MRDKPIELRPKTCIACPISNLHICGRERKVQVSSSAAYTEVIPDERCKYRRTDKVGQDHPMNK
jgi:hypothetical protein